MTLHDVVDDRGLRREQGWSKDPKDQKEFFDRRQHNELMTSHKCLSYISKSCLENSLKPVLYL